MKKFTIVFGMSLAGIVVCLVMTVYTGVKQHQVQMVPQPLSIPTPALSQ